MSITASITGTVLEAKTASFFDEQNVQQTYGKIQLIVPDMSGDFKSIRNIKVRLEHFGWLPDILAQKGKQVTLSLEPITYSEKTSFYLAKPIKPLAKAS